MAAAPAWLRESGSVGGSRWCKFCVFRQVVEVRTDGGASVAVIDEDAQVRGCCCAERGGVRDGAGSRRWWCVVAARMVRDGGENGGSTAAAAMEMAVWRGGCAELLEQRFENAEKMVAI